MTSRNFDNWLQAYLTYTDNTEPPEKFHLWTGISVIAAALRRRVWIDQGHFQWQPNFYIILVSPPGIVSKSTTIGIGEKLMAQIPDFHSGPESMTWQSLASAMSEAHELVSFPEGEFYDMSCITCSPGELGTFLKPTDTPMLDFLTRMWDNRQGVFCHRTRTTGSLEIINPWLNIISATTPAWLKNNVTEGMIGGGLIPRMIFVYAEKKRKYIAYPGRTQKRADLEEMEKLLVADLAAMSDMRGEFILTDAAIEWGEKWYADHGDATPKEQTNEKFAPYRARKQTHLHKLAMICAAAESNECVLDKHHLERALAILEDAEQDMMRVYENIGLADNANKLYKIISYISNFPERTAPQLDVYQAMLPEMSEQEFSEALTTGIKAQYLATRKRGSEVVLVILQDPRID